jgi:hypothetical protein
LDFIIWFGFCIFSFVGKIRTEISTAVISIPEGSARNVIVRSLKPNNSGLVSFPVFARQNLHDSCGVIGKKLTSQHKFGFAIISSGTLHFAWEIVKCRAEFQHTCPVAILSISVLISTNSAKRTIFDPISTTLSPSLRGIPRNLSLTSPDCVDEDESV